LEALAKAVPIALLAFVVSSMLAVGLSLTVREIVTPLRNGKLLALAVVANFVLMPLAAILIARVFQLAEPLGVALLILGAAPARRSFRSSQAPQRAISPFPSAMVPHGAHGRYMPVVLPLLLPGVWSINADRSIARASCSPCCSDSPCGSGYRRRSSGTVAQSRLVSEPNGDDGADGDNERETF
jgi:hypothetical protein